MYVCMEMYIGLQYGRMYMYSARMYYQNISQIYGQERQNAYVKRWNIVEHIANIANMSLSAPECICELMEYICTKIHVILSQKDREKEGDILFHVCTHANIYSASVRQNVYVQCQNVLTECIANIRSSAVECILAMFLVYRRMVKCGRMYM